MDINKVLIEYDNMFGIHSLDEIEDYLTGKLDEAYAGEDYFSSVTLLNELMGFCRDTGQNSKGIGYCRQVVELMDRLNLKGTTEYATTLLNVANAYRAFGLLDESAELYCSVDEIYKERLPQGDFNYASLYNNWSLLYQEMGEFFNAKMMLERALEIVDRYPKAVMEQATTRTNLAVTLLKISGICKVSGGNDRERPNIIDNASDDVHYDADEYYEMAMQYLTQALEIYEKDGGRDFHYSAALSAMGDALYMHGEYAEASEYYRKSMDELEKHVGRTEAYERVAANYDNAVRRAEESLRHSMEAKQQVIEPGCRDEESDYHAAAVGSQSEQPKVGAAGPDKFTNNAERCRTFYERYGAPMIHEKFPEYERRIAVGLVGEGSDCFGFDDDISADHDYGIGFCMWLLDTDYEKTGELLQSEYQKLVLEYGTEFYARNGGGKNMNTQADRFIDSRRGVFRIKDFYRNILGIDFDITESAISENGWLGIADDKLATAINGAVFRDDEGTFTSVRNMLKGYYPEKVWRLKLAEELHIFSQSGQYNYARMMARKDYVTANICVAQAVRSAMSIVYILNRSYAPYYKWMRRGMDGLRILSGIAPILDEISVTENQMQAWEGASYNPYEVNRRDRISASFEAVAVLILSELNRQKIINGNDTFLDVYCEETAMVDVNEGSRSELIDRIVMQEWQQFDKVKNEGGRADCQDDWNTFSLMRKSQYMAWTDELLKSYLKDLQDAGGRGWNLIMEKYARMMESTAPERFAELKDKLPVRSGERIAIQEEIIKIQVAWMEEFAEKYPKMAGNARSIHTSEDSAYNTSYETYLRGELGTYSEETFMLYGRFIVALNRQGENLAYNIMHNTAMLYGYKSVEDAEDRLE